MILVHRTLLEAVAIALLGWLAGLAVNHRLVLDAFAGRLAAPPPAVVAATATTAVPQPVLLAEVRDLLAAGALPVDARDEALYADGHLPGALSLPLGDVVNRLASFRQQVAGERTLVLYCNGYGCPDSFDLGVQLIAAGFQDVRVYEGGFPEWQDAGLPVDKVAP
jgi:rhodanese-related sulfurtransferase